jgi:hypothetical protein
MMGLERLIQKTYQTTPQIDLDRKILRARVPRPVALDFPALADGITRANVGTAAIEVDVAFDVKDGKVVLKGTGQSFPLQGPSSAGSRLRVMGWETAETIKLEIVR